MFEATCAHCGVVFERLREDEVHCHKRRCQDARRSGAPPVEPRLRGRLRAREFRLSVKAYVRAGGELAWLARRTGIDVEDLDGLLRGRFHWLAPSAARALSDQIRVPVVTEYPELVLATIPTCVIRPYIDEVIEKHGVARSEGVIGIGQRRMFALRQQPSVTPEFAERIILATAGPSAFFDDANLRRYWWSSLPSATLNVRRQKLVRQRERRQAAARQLVAA